MAAPPLFTLVHAVLKAVITLGLVGVPGFIGGSIGLIDRDFLQRLSRFQVTFLMPSLAFSTFGSRFSLAAIGKIWPLVFWSVAQLVAGMVLSRLILHSTRHGARLAQPGSEAWGVLLNVAVTFQNIGVFNFPLIMALCSTPGLFEQEHDQCYGEGILMIFGYHIPWDFSLWTIGYASLMALREDAGEGGKTPTAEQHSLKDPAASPPAGRKGDAFAMRRVRRAALELGKHIQNPMLMAMLSGIVVGLTPPLRLALFGNAAPFGPLGDALKQLGAPAPVVGMTILCGTLGCEIRHLRSGGSAGLSLSERRSWMVAVLAGKLVLIPCIGFTLWLCLSMLQDLEFNTVGLAFGVPAAVSKLASAVWPSDKLLRAVVVMQWSAPSCLNIMVLCHRAGLQPKILQAVTALYVVMYGITALTTTFWVASGLSLF